MMLRRGWSRTVVMAVLTVTVGVALSGCGGSSKSSAAGCLATHSTPGQVSSRSGAVGVGAAWTLPGADLANTRDVASPIDSANVKTLGVSWCVPVPTNARGQSDGYSTTAVVVNGVVYTQDLKSNVLAIRLSDGQVLWRHTFNQLNGGPDGVNVAGGVVYAATSRAAVALSAATGKQLWSRTLIGNNHEGIDMAPGYDDGTVYVSTVPVNPLVGQYLGGGKGVLWALNAKTGTTKWSWDQVGNLWGHPSINSGGGLWYPPSFDAAGDVYLGVANPGPIATAGFPPKFPWGTSRPGPDLYTDSVVKLSPQGKLLWYYQLTPHDLFDWDLQDSPVLTTANGRHVVIDAGKAGIMIELNAQTGKLIWKRPVGVHGAQGNDGLISEHATPRSHIRIPAKFTLSPGPFGGVLSPLATNGTATFAAVNDYAVPITSKGLGESAATFYANAAKSPGEMVAVDQDTGKLMWDDKLPSAPFGAAAVTNNVVLTTTFTGHLYAFNATTGAILLDTPLSAATNAAVTIDGDYVIVGSGAVLSRSQHALIVAYRLGANGKLPDTVTP
jgi:outer membrane protein assembly factor BamB